MKRLRELTTLEEVEERLGLILQDRFHLSCRITGPRPSLAQRKAEPGIGPAWLANRKLEEIRTAAAAVGVTYGGDGVISYRV